MMIRDLHGKVLRVHDLETTILQVHSLVEGVKSVSDVETAYWSDILYKLKNIWYRTY